MIDDRVENNGRLPRLAVADDQFALPAPDRNHAVNRFDARLERLAHRLAVDHAWRNALQRITLFRKDGAFVIHGQPQRIHHAPDQRLAHRHGHNRVRALHHVAFLQLRSFSEQHHAHLFFFQVQRNAVNVVWKRQHFAGHDLLQTVHACNAVADADDCADFVHRHGLLVILDLLAQNLADFVRLDVCHACSVAAENLSRNYSRQQRATKSFLLRRQPAAHLI